MEKTIRTQKLVLFDKEYGECIAGCDEAGRGPLAGPVVCAACIMPLDDIIDGVYDSKCVSAKNREALFEKILEKSLSFCIKVVDSDIIDEINILRATKKGMAEAINGLSFRPKLVLVDAVTALNVEIECCAVIKGDAKSYNIAAASILAKVFRDRIMCEYEIKYPGYDFSRNKGYGTAKHVAALKKMGATPIHRKLFIRNALSEQLEFFTEEAK